MAQFATPMRPEDPIALHLELALTAARIDDVARRVADERHEARTPAVTVGADRSHGSVRGAAAGDIGANIHVRGGGRLTGLAPARARFVRSGDRAPAAAAAERERGRAGHQQRCSRRISPIPLRRTSSAPSTVRRRAVRSGPRAASARRRARRLRSRAHRTPAARQGRSRCCWRCSPSRAPLRARESRSRRSARDRCARR